MNAASKATLASATSAALHQVVIVGGGAGGLELATTLGDSLGKRGRAVVTLVDKGRSHVWKPKLHEIAAGSMDMGLHEVDYLAQAHWHHFRYRVGEMTGLDRAARMVQVAAVQDEGGQQVTPTRNIHYDTLVIAVGSLSNDFGTPGVSEYALKLESADDARRFHRRLVNAAIRAHAQQTPREAHQLQVAIIGAGATGVELSAELHRTTRELVAYGLDQIDAEKDICINLIEASPRILPALPERFSASTERLLRQLGVVVHTNAKVAAILPNAVLLADAREIPAELMVWAAGVKAPEFLKDLAGLESNRINQLVVRPTLQTTRDDDIFVLGDCAACAWPDTAQASDNATRTVPPRAQAAHQQATHVATQIKRRLKGKAPSDYRYRDFGSLVSLGEFATVGNMLAGASDGKSGYASLMIEGRFARMMYLSLYKMHELALHGFTKVALDTIARSISRRTEPHVKLH